MENFKEYYGLANEDITLAPINVGHRTTHTLKKRNIVTNENDFFTAINGIQYGRDSILLGVVGNFRGWAHHERQYTNLGFNLDQVVLCENGKDEYNSLLYGYIRRIVGVRHIRPGVFNPHDLMKHVLNITRNSDQEYIIGYNQSRDNIIYIKAPGRPALVYGTIESGSITPGEQPDKKVESLLSAIPPRVEHLDFDITSSLTNATQIVNMNNAFYEGFPRLRSCVQVHFGQRGLEATNPDADAYATDQSANFENLVSDREMSAIYDGFYRDHGQAMRIEETVESITQQLEQNGRGVYIQLYPGRSGRTMISVSSVRQGESLGFEVDDAIKDKLGTSNIKMIQTVRNRLQQNQPELADTLTQLLNSIS